MVRDPPESIHYLRALLSIQARSSLETDKGSSPPLIRMHQTAWCAHGLKAKAKQRWRAICLAIGGQQAQPLLWGPLREDAGHERQYIQ
jgi:hypothetical protein